MNYRINSAAVVAVVVLVTLAIVLFTYTAMKNRSADSDLEESASIVEETPAIERIISGKHQYIDSTHAIAGLVSLPTPCHTIVVEPFFVNEDASSTDSDVELRFTTVLEGDECPDIISDAPFKVTFDAPEEVEITGIWDGTQIRLNLMPVGPGESLDEQFYFKG